MSVCFWCSSRVLILPVSGLPVCLSSALCHHADFNAEFPMTSFTTTTTATIIIINIVVVVVVVDVYSG
jgi:hypothetical protein